MMARQRQLWEGIFVFLYLYGSAVSNSGLQEEKAFKGQHTFFDHMSV